MHDGANNGGTGCIGGWAVRQGKRMELRCKEKSMTMFSLGFEEIGTGRTVQRALGLQEKEKKGTVALGVVKLWV